MKTYMEEYKRLQKICMSRCKQSNNKDSCYSYCVFWNDFDECMARRSGTGIPQCQPAFFGPEASKYGELPK